MKPQEQISISSPNQPSTQPWHMEGDLFNAPLPVHGSVSGELFDNASNEASHGPVAAEIAIGIGHIAGKGSEVKGDATEAAQPLATSGKDKWLKPSPPPFAAGAQTPAEREARQQLLDAQFGSPYGPNAVGQARPASDPNVHWRDAATKKRNTA